MIWTHLILKFKFKLKKKKKKPKNVEIATSSTDNGNPESLSSWGSIVLLDFCFRTQTIFFEISS